MLLLAALAFLALAATWRLIASVAGGEVRVEPLSRGPPVHLVIPSCGDENLREVLPKWLSQIYDNYRIIIVEDCKRIYIDSERVKVLYRGDRRGYKGGALNYALRYAAGDGAPKYVMVVDADHEPPDEHTIGRFVALIERLGADLVQGVQRHLDFGGALDGLVVLGHEISGKSMAGRARLGLAPIFTGSTAIMRFDRALGLGFPEDTVTEDLDFSIRLWLSGGRIHAVYGLYTLGRPPRNLAAYVRQQLRWSSGTFRVFVRYLPQILASRRLSPLQKVDLVMQGTIFAQGGLFLVATAYLAYCLATGVHLALEVALFAYTAAVNSAMYVAFAYRTGTYYRLGYLPLEVLTAVVHLAGTVMGALGREYRWEPTRRKSLPLPLSLYKL